MKRQITPEIIHSYRLFYKVLFPDESPETISDEEVEEFIILQIDGILEAFPKEREIIEMHYGLGDGYRYEPEEYQRVFRKIPAGRVIHVLDQTIPSIRACFIGAYEPFL